MACVAGKANLEALLEDSLIENSRIGNLLHERLNQIQNKFSEHLAYIQGRGLLAAAIFMDSNGKPLSSLCD